MRRLTGSAAVNFAGDERQERRPRRAGARSRCTPLLRAAAAAPATRPWVASSRARSSRRARCGKMKLHVASKVKIKPANAAELLLEIYNELRLERDASRRFSDMVSDAVDAFEAQRDHRGRTTSAAFADAASKVFGGGKKPMSGAAMLERAARPKVAEKRPRGIDGQITSSTSSSADFKGAIKQTNVRAGYHSIKGAGRPTHEALRRRRPLAVRDLSAASARSSTSRTCKETQSTFFPDSASADRSHRRTMTTFLPRRRPKKDASPLDAIPTSVNGMTPGRPSAYRRQAPRS